MALYFGYKPQSSEEFDDTELKKDISALKTGIATNNVKTQSIESNYFKKDGSIQMTGDLDLGDNSIVGIHNINADNSVPSKKYITDELAKKLPRDGSLDMTGTLGARGIIMINGMINMANQRIRFLPSPSQDTDAATKKYVDDKTVSIATNTSNITAAGVRLTALENIRRNYTYHFDYFGLGTTWSYPASSSANGKPYHWMYCKNMTTKSRFHVHTFSWDTDSFLESNYILTFRLDFFKTDGAHTYVDSIFTARIGDHRIVGERLAFIDKKYDPSTLTDYQNFVMARLAVKGSSVKGNEFVVSCSFEI